MGMIDHHSEFLHTLASPLGTALLIAESLYEDALSSPGFDEGMANQLKSLVDALENIRKMLRVQQRKGAA